MHGLPGNDFAVVVGVSKAIRQIVDLVDTVATSDCGVLIEGESGTGKELVAQRLHARSRRRGEAFIPVNCAGISDTLFESQFFGHIRGAFTGAEQAMKGLILAADRGTLFMDEVGEIPPHVQPKLLRVFQDGEFIPVGTTAPVRSDTRFIAATNRNLREEVREGRFRDDLFYRLNIVRIFIPPLRERPDDIEPLLEHLMARAAVRYQRPAISLGEAVRRRLAAFPWPGNVRQLGAWIEGLYATCGDPVEMVEALYAAEAPASRRLSPELEPVITLVEAERLALQRAVEACDRNLPKAAALLQIHRTTLWRKLKEHNLSVVRPRTR
jgi:transcriptional regulator with PAS, ATPase and Fis domain